MKAQNFAAFVESQQNANGDSETSGLDLRKEWLKSLDSLYKHVIEFLQEFITKGAIRYKFTKITLNEEGLGIYSARRMDVKIGRQSVILEPIGTMFIGCKGRVDVVGSTGLRVQILLVSEKVKSARDLIPKVTVNRSAGSALAPPRPEKIRWVWKILAHDLRGARFTDLDKESFFEVLMEVSNASAARRA
jgi:hypothetical protein